MNIIICALKEPSSYMYVYDGWLHSGRGTIATTERANYDRLVGWLDLPGALSFSPSLSLSFTLCLSLCRATIGRRENEREGGRDASPSLTHKARSAAFFWSAFLLETSELCEMDLASPQSSQTFSLK